MKTSETDKKEKKTIISSAIRGIWRMVAAATPLATPHGKGFINPGFSKKSPRPVTRPISKDVSIHPLLRPMARGVWHCGSFKLHSLLCFKQNLWKETLGRKEGKDTKTFLRVFRRRSSLITRYQTSQGIQDQSYSSFNSSGILMMNSVFSFSFYVLIVDSMEE